MAIKPDERAFWLRIVSEGKTPRQIIAEPGFPIAEKRALYLLQKWADAGLYEYGVCVDLGWATPEGIANGLELKR